MSPRTRHIRRIALVVTALTCGVGFAVAGPAKRQATPPLEPSTVVSRLLSEELLSQGAWRKLEHLSDDIGQRFAGTAGAERAVQWTLEEMRRDGLEQVRPEKVMVPRWVRGEARAEVVAPVKQPLFPLALGGSPGTPPEGVTAPVVIVSSLEELAAAGEKVKGSIVLFNKQIVPNGGEENGYGAGAKLRGKGPAEASKLGAVGALVRSLGTAILRTPHTGQTRFEEGVKPIPAAAVTAEDAELLARLAKRGQPPVVTLRLGCQTLPDVPSANVLAELTGREKPEEIVLISAHLDTWDVGQGAVDDGAGVAAVMESMRLLKSLGFRPRRTIRAVLYMNEEFGLSGAKEYARAHAAELDRHVVAIESDAGAGRPSGLTIDTGPGGAAQLVRLLAPLEPLGMGRVVEADDGGSDIWRLKPAGVPLSGLMQDTTHYFDWHHSEADTLDKVDRQDLVYNVVLMAYGAWALAEAKEVLPRIPAEEAAASALEQSGRKVEQTSPVKAPESP